VPDESMDAEVSDGITVNNGAVVDKSYTMSDPGSDEEDGERGSGAGSEAGGNGAPAAAEGGSL